LALSGGFVDQLVGEAQDFVDFSRLEQLFDLADAKGAQELHAVQQHADQCRWSYIKQQSNDVKHLIDVVFPWLRKIESIIAKAADSDADLANVGSRMSDAYFQLDPNKGAILAGAIDLIDELFGHVDTAAVSDDIMGDTFEYLLGEISTAGKNGQFRTPRQIIRTLVALLEIEPGMRIIDPAAGTGGFLFSAMGYLLQTHTPAGNLKLEWDGTPHRADGSQLGDLYDNTFQADNFVGFDNDRTMVRIGWMNMILHGIDQPRIYQRDSLAKLNPEDAGPEVMRLAASESYDRVLANPPFTGTVDNEGLALDLFPTESRGPRGKKSSVAVTNKSELLFVWLMLDLLKVGGRCAVIIPEGVLFGSTDAHQRLRRELLTEHLLEAVISLPPGAFQPYTGVKTSILVFQKETAKQHARSWKTTETPRTGSVWFYEVTDECYTLDAKRQERKGQDNDLWDALEKFRHRHEGEAEHLAYYQPEYHTERWRFVDQTALQTFSENREVAIRKDQVATIEELFGLPANPDEALARVQAEQAEAIRDLAADAIMLSLSAARDKLEKANTEKTREKLVAAELKKAQTLFRRHAYGKPVKQCFGNGDSLAYPIYQTATKAAFEERLADAKTRLQTSEIPMKSDKSEGQLAKQAKAIATAYARLDGYDVTLRSLETQPREKALEESKSWRAPVRVYADNSEWQSEDGKITGSHDEQGQVRPEYLADIQLYDDKGRLNPDLLDPDCIEARGWNLAAGQYKPFNFAAAQSDQSVAEMIRELKRKEQEIVEGLDRLLGMVEGA